MANKKKVSNTLKQLFGDDLNQELRQLIDLAVRRQLSIQDVTERLVNTKFFRRTYPGIVEKNGTLANALTGEQGVSVSPSSLGGAIKNYRTALNDFGEIAKTYGYKNFGKDQLAHAIKNQTSAQEFGARLQAVETIDSNPALKAAAEQQAKALGYKLKGNELYRAAVGAGDAKFMNLYEAAKYQTDLGLGKKDATDLAKGALPAAATFDDVNQIIDYARHNLQALQPELAAQGISPSRLVKILANPGANGADIEKIKALATQRQALFGRAPQGSYAQQGAGGGLSTYGAQGEAAY